MLHSGQRVRHARFGTGVTTVCTEDRTTIEFEDHGAKTFVASMLEVEVLSEPGTAVAAGRRKSPSKKAAKAGPVSRS